MQIDYELIKRILNVLVEKPSYYLHTSILIEEAKSPYQEIDIEEYKNQFYGHLLLLRDNKVIEQLNGNNGLNISYNLNNTISVSGCYIRLTSLGYDFIKALNKNGLIDKIKKATLTETLKIAEGVLINGISNFFN